MNFNLNKAAIHQALLWEKTLKIFLLPNSRKILFWISFALFLLFAFLFLPYMASPSYDTALAGSLRFLLRVLVLFSTVFLISWNINLFFAKKLSKPKIRTSLEYVSPDTDEDNLAELLSFDSARTAEGAKNSSLRLFYNLISRNRDLNFVFFRALLNTDEIKKALKERMADSAEQEDKAVFSNVIKESLMRARKMNHSRIEPGDLLCAFSRQEPVFKNILIEKDLRPEDIESLVSWFESLEKKAQKRKRFWEWENLTRNVSIGSDWAAGYTLTLDRFSTDWRNISGASWQEEISAYDEEIKNLEMILGQGGVHNALIVGDPGTGRKNMVQSLAHLIISGRSLPELNYKRIVVLDIVSVLSRCQTLDEVEATLDDIFSEAVSAQNVILVVDEFYSFVSQPSGKIGAVDISSILLRYLPLPDFRLIGITSYMGYHLFIEKNPSILKFMGKVELPEMTEEETMPILQNRALNFEYRYKKFISYQALRDIIKYSGRYIADLPFPKKAIDLLEEVVFYTLRYAKSQVVLPEHVSKIVSKNTDIPVGALEQKEKDVLLNMEDLIHKRIINQEEAVNEVSAALRRARADITVRKGPMGCFLFLGPTGVGKTETSKALAEVYFGSEDRMIRIDMSEFQSVVDIPRLLGTTDEEGLLTTPVRESPFSLVLLDEIEKAHPNVLNLFLQVLDEGHITDGLGRKTDFKNTIIIATSNAGYQVILEALKKGEQMSEIKDDLLDFLYKEKIFRPEFLNRFDALVVFKSLTKEHLMAIANLLLLKLKKNLKDKEIDFVITDGLKEKVVELGYDPIFGARQMRRVIQDKIENVLAVALLSNKIKKGKKAEINPEDFSLKIL